MIGHPFNLERIINIVVQEKKLSLDSLDINSDDYNIESDIDQVNEWMGYSDAHRIIRFGLDNSVKHIMMLSIQLIDEIRYIEDESTYDKLRQVIDMMQEYITEYQYDRKRHSICHINSGQYESYDLTSNAYNIEKHSKYHIFLRFYEYFRNAISSYIEIKKELLSFLKQTKSDVAETALIQKYEEVKKFMNLRNDVNSLIQNVIEVYNENKNEKEIDQELFNNLNAVHNIDDPLYLLQNPLVRGLYALCKN